MKKTIFALGLIATLASCGGNGKAEGEAANADSTAVAVDSVATTTVVADSAKVDSVATK
jgi:hypothetical protein